MASAQTKLKTALDAVTLKPPAVTVVSNVTASPHEGADHTRSLLTRQVTSSVRWEESIRYLLAQGFTRFIELGPGTALTGFTKRIDKNATTINVADVASLELTLKTLLGAS